MICIPGPLHIIEKRGHPYYYQNEESFDVVTLKKLASKDSSALTGFGLVVKSEYEDQPILIATGDGGYLVQTHPLRILEASLFALRARVLGVYPLHGLIRYKEAASEETVNRLKELIQRKESIIAL